MSSTDDFDWTPDRVAQLRALWDEGITGAEIGYRIGCSRDAAIGKARRLGLPPRPTPIPAGIVWTPEQMQQATAMRLAGASYTEIGKALGRSGNTVTGKLLRAGVHKPEGVPERRMGAPSGRKPRPIDMDKALAMRAAGAAKNEIASVLGISKDRIREALASPEALASGTHFQDRPALDAGSPETWGAITAGTSLAGMAWPA